MKKLFQWLLVSLVALVVIVIIGIIVYLKFKFWVTYQWPLMKFKFIVSGIILLVLLLVGASIMFMLKLKKK